MAGSTVSRWVEVATLKELSRRRRQLVDADGEQVALFYVDGHVYALHDVCMHKGRNLSRGTILHGRVICPGHQWAFDLQTGWVDAQERCQPTYDVKVEGEMVYIDPERRVRIESPEEDIQPSEEDEERA